MSRRVGDHLRALLIAVYGLATLSGPGSHGLTGCAHGTARIHDDAGRGLLTATPLSSENCPICHFHGLGQLPFESAPITSPIERVRCRTAIERPESFPRVDHSPSNPRAPPSPSSA